MKLIHTSIAVVFFNEGTEEWITASSILLPLLINLIWGHYFPHLFDQQPLTIKHRSSRVFNPILCFSRVIMNCAEVDEGTIDLLYKKKVRRESVKPTWVKYHIWDDSVEIDVNRIEVGAIKSLPLSPPSVLKPHCSPQETERVHQDILQTNGKSWNAINSFRGAGRRGYGILRWCWAGVVFWWNSLLIENIIGRK